MTVKGLSERDVTADIALWPLQFVSTDDDLARAQQMMDDLTTRNWFHFLNALARRLNPWMSSRNPLDLRGYYWTVR